ncbi:hypothetical protein [Actinoplanes sp. RD1]|uniref:hypothetical protein n=1 Tax=Actinoplanes sp. RD1 TaxID=3064538 RepID=UPI002741D1AF|nr:hypothetical protein [Actinoplanes sp. RD1]
MRWWTIIDVRAGAAAIVAALMARVLLREASPGTVTTLSCAGLIAAAALSAYGVIRTAPGRRVVLLVAAGALLLMGIVGLASIGIPLLVAAVLALVAARTTRPRPEPGDDPA